MEKKGTYKSDASYPKDTDFSRIARTRQSEWRKMKKYPADKGNLGKYGNFLDVKFAKTEKVNFLTENIRYLVTQEIENAKKSKALIGEPRIWNNLLSSQPVCFNLFGEFYFDLNLATTFFQKLFPRRIDKVMAIKFEYSPGRKDPKYLNDRSAFDVFVEYRKGDKRGFIGIEVKYAESLKEETQAQAKKIFDDPEKKYEHWAKKSKIFKPNTIEFLKQPPISQIWRDHLLCIATKQDYDDGFFVFLYPKKNKECENGVKSYIQHLAFDDEKQNCFYPRYLEDFFDALTKSSNANWTNELKQRYEI